MIIRTGIKVRHHETLAGHPAGLMDEHVGSLVVRVVCDQETGRLSVVRVERLNDLCSLAGVSENALTMGLAGLRTNLRARSGAHVQTLLRISLLPGSKEGTTGLVVRLNIKEKGRDHRNGLLSAQVALHRSATC